jgi:hypothetical protein
MDLEAATSELLAAAMRTDDDWSVAGVILGMFSDEIPWSEIDQAIPNLTPMTHAAYLQFRSAAIAAGHDPLWTKDEHILYDRLSAVTLEYIRLHSEFGRAPTLRDFGNLPTNPYTESGVIIGSDALYLDPIRAVRAGWTYDDGRLPRAVIPVGVHCRLPSSEIERVPLPDRDIIEASALAVPDRWR